MSDGSQSRFLGIGKTMFNTGATLLTVSFEGQMTWHTSLSERIERKKYSRSWPLKALKGLSIDTSAIHESHIAHNSDIMAPSFKEALLDKVSPFYEMLKLNSLTNCTEQGNSKITYIEHHIAHAYSALAVSPYENCFVLVMDGGGSKREDTNCKEEGRRDDIEHTSVYYWDGQNLKLLFKEWLNYEQGKVPGIKFSKGIGSLYEKVAQFIFSDPLCSGKVMGLAGFGKKFDGLTCEIDLAEFLNNLDWTKAYDGGSRQDWQNSSNLPYWKDLAASAQFLFEENLKRIATRIEDEFMPRYGDLPLVMTGGCALNCTGNEKLRSQDIFPEIFVSPFPGDESISLGCAVARVLKLEKIKLSTIPWPKQNSFFGPAVNFELVPKLFEKYKIEVISDYSKTCELLKKGEVIAWFQGRSESGPRALGHRSLLASVKKEGLKDFLNSEIKFRESFRPYGASVLFEDASTYFDIPRGFQNPFMSFTSAIAKNYRKDLIEVCHVDGTCRMQTVMQTQNLPFYNLLKTLKGSGEMPILLNTSLNIMGEPIVESLEDALVFFEQSIVRVMVIDSFLITKEEEL